MTIHRFAGLLRKHFNVPETQTQTNTEQCVSSPVLIVIDESSMISLSTIAMFVNVVRMYTTTPHIIFLGDMVQLSPVGYGSPFMDLIESDIATNTTLDVVHRQLCQICSANFFRFVGGCSNSNPRREWLDWNISGRAVTSIECGCSCRSAG